MDEDKSDKPPEKREERVESHAKQLDPQKGKQRERIPPPPPPRLEDIDWSSVEKLRQTSGEQFPPRPRPSDEDE